MAEAADGSLLLDPAELTLAVRPSGSLAQSLVANLGRTQPLLPRWRVQVVDGSRPTRGLQTPAANVAVVGVAGLGYRARASGGLVFVLESPTDAAGWAGAGSMVLADDPPAYLAQAVQETALGRVWICDRVASFLPQVIGPWASKVAGRSRS